MASQTEVVEFEFLPHFRVFKTGRVERLSIIASVIATPVASRDTVIDPAVPVSARLYLPPSASLDKKSPLLVYFHGGGFCIESVSSPTYHHYLNSLAAQAGVVIVSVEYRLAPEHPLSAVYDDCWAALQWAVGGGCGDPWISKCANLGKIFLAGDSAGGNIVHRMAVKAGAEGGVKVEGLVLVHPYFSIGQEEEGSYWDRLRRMLCAGTKEGMLDPWLDPTKEGNEEVAAMVGQRLLVFVAEQDYLMNNGTKYYNKVKGSGWKGQAELVETKGEGHVFHLDKPECEKAKELMEKVVAFLNV